MKVKQTKKLMLPHKTENAVFSKPSNVDESPQERTRFARNVIRYIIAACAHAELSTNRFNMDEDILHLELWVGKKPLHVEIDINVMRFIPILKMAEILKEIVAQ